MSLVGKIQELLQQMEDRPRDPAYAINDEIVLAHPQEHHGLFIRDGGAIDFSSGSQVVGLGRDGIAVNVQFVDVLASAVHFQASTFWLDVGRDGLVIDGYVPDYGILHGQLISHYLRDARVVVLRGSVRPLESSQGPVSEQPVDPRFPQLVSVPLSELLQPVPWSRPLEARALEMFQRVINRARGGSGA